MSLKIAVQMDPIQRISIKGDSTFALLLEAQKRGHQLSYYIPDRLALLNGRLFATVESLSVRDPAGDSGHPRPRRDQGVPRRARRHRDEAAVRPRRRSGVPYHA